MQMHLVSELSFDYEILSASCVLMPAYSLHPKDFSQFFERQRVVQYVPVGPKECTDIHGLIM